MNEKLKYAPGPWCEGRYGEVMDATGAPVVFSPGFSIGSVTGNPERAAAECDAATVFLDSMEKAQGAAFCGENIRALKIKEGE